MAAVRMFIDKFGKEVTIDEDHPLAVAQRARPVLARVETTMGVESDALEVTPTFRSTKRGRR